MNREQQEHVEEMLFKSYLGLLTLRTILKRLHLPLALEATEQTLKAIGDAYPAFVGRSALRGPTP